MSDNHDVDYLRAKTGIKSWLITIDHKRLGLMYLGSVLFFFLVGGLAALAVGLESVKRETCALFRRESPWQRASGTVAVAGSGHAGCKEHS